MKDEHAIEQPAWAEALDAVYATTIDAYQSDAHGCEFSTGAELGALASVLGLERKFTQGKRLWWTLWLVRGRAQAETDAELRERTRAALGAETGADVSWWGRP